MTNFILCSSPLFSTLWVFLEEKFGQKEANHSVFKFASCLSIAKSTAYFSLMDDVHLLSHRLFVNALKNSGNKFCVHATQSSLRTSFV